MVHLPWEVPRVTAMILKALQVPYFPVFSPSRTLCGTHRPCRHHQCSVISCCSRCARSFAQLKAVLARGRGGGGCSTGGWAGAPGQGTGPRGHPGWSSWDAASPSLTSMTAWWVCLTPWWGWGNMRAPTASCQVRTQPLCSLTFHFRQINSLTLYFSPVPRSPAAFCSNFVVGIMRLFDWQVTAIFPARFLHYFLILTNKKTCWVFS